MVRWAVLLVGLGACGTRGEGNLGTDSADPTAGTGDPVPDGSVPDDVAYPQPSEWYTSAAIFDSLARGEIREGQAALYLLQILFGDADAVPQSLLTTTPGTAPAEVHGFVGDVVDRIDSLPDEDAAALQAYLLETTGLEVSGRRARSNLTPYGAEDWCSYDRGLSGCVDLLLPMRPACDRDAAGNLLVDSSGLWSPPGCSPDRDPDKSCETYPASVFRPNAWSVHGALKEAIEGSVPLVTGGLGLSCSPGDWQVRVLDSSTAYWQSNGIRGVADPGSGIVDCVVFLTSTPPISSSWLSTEDTLQSVTVHELFHCGQFASGHAGSANWLREGTAKWAEDHIGRQLWPGMDAEHDRFDDYFVPRNFLDRSYDALFPLAFLGNPAGLDPQLGFSLVKDADPLGALVGSSGFEPGWHDASVATWNRAPAEPYLNDGRALSGTSAPADGGLLGKEEVEEFLMESVAPLSYTTERFEVDAEVQALSIDSYVDSDLVFSVIIEGGDKDRVEEYDPGTPLRLCYEAVGICHEEDPADLDDATHVGFVATNLSPSETAGGQIVLDSWSPRLHGQWRTTSLASTALPGVVVQQGGVVSIDEEASPDAFNEALDGATVYDGLPLDCSSAGSVSGTLFTTYAGTSEDTAWGTLESVTASGSASLECRDASGTVTNTGATPGLWIIAAVSSPWAPVTFELDGDDLRVSSAAVGGVQWVMNLTRISDAP